MIRAFRSPEWRPSDRMLVALVACGVALPLIVAVVALAQRRWYPVLDLAMTEFRVRDVGSRQTPLIGLPGRIGQLPNQGSHPGPLSFWLLAPGYRLFGGSAWAMEVATVSIALVWIVLALWMGRRRLGPPGVAMVATVIAVLVRGFGLSVLTQPWNPYMPLLAWLVVLLATWAVVDGDDVMLLPLVVAASFAAETHVPYLLMAGGLGILAAGSVVVRWWRARSSDDVDARPRWALALTVGTFVVLWAAPLVEQIRHDPGNISRLIDHFGSPDEEPIGWSAGFRLMLRHLDVVGAHLHLLTGQERFVQSGFDPDGPIWPGLVTLAVWIGAAIVATRLRHRALMSLHGVLAVTLLLTTVSMARIFGQRWYYLTLWAWITTTLILVAIAWTALVWCRLRRPALTTWTSAPRIGALGAVAAVVVTTSMVVLAPATDHPEEYLGDTLGELVEPTAAALEPDRTYVVEWKDAYFFGSQAFGLVNELRRAGFAVGGGEFWRVPMTNSRTVPDGAADAALVFVTGGFVDEWRDDPRFVELVSVDPRSPDERGEFDGLRTELIADLTANGLDDLVSGVDDNLFGVNIDQRISATARTASARMIRLGQETAVFLGPPAAASL